MNTNQSKYLQNWGLVLLSFFIFLLSPSYAQRIPQALEYTEIYDFLEELTTDGIIRSNAAIKPYTRDAIARMLAEAQTKDSLLNRRQRDDLQFYMQDYALELDTLPTYYSYGHRHVTQWKTNVSNLSLADPSLHILTKNKIFKMRVRPILGMDLTYNTKGLLQHRWYGVDIQMDIAKHLSIWGSIRDNSWGGLGVNGSKIHFGWTRVGDRMVGTPALNNIPGVQYKEANYGGDFSDSRGGISLYTWWGSVGIQRERIQWGDAQHCSNILSAHNPAVPMFTIQLTPCKWFQFDYFHAWLPSNVIDSTYYYVERQEEDVFQLIFADTALQSQIHNAQGRFHCNPPNLPLESFQLHGGFYMPCIQVRPGIAERLLRSGKHRSIRGLICILIHIGAHSIGQRR